MTCLGFEHGVGGGEAGLAFTHETLLSEKSSLVWVGNLGPADRNGIWESQNLDSPPGSGLDLLD